MWQYLENKGAKIQQNKIRTGFVKWKFIMLDKFKLKLGCLMEKWISKVFVWLIVLSPLKRVIRSFYNGILIKYGRQFGGRCVISKKKVVSKDDTREDQAPLLVGY